MLVQNLKNKWQQGLMNVKMSKTVSVCATLWTCVVDLSDKITFKRDVGSKSWNALWEPEGQFE